MPPCRAVLPMNSMSTQMRSTPLASAMRATAGSFVMYIKLSMLKILPYLATVSPMFSLSALVSTLKIVMKKIFVSSQRDS